MQNSNSLNVQFLYLKDICSFENGDRGENYPSNDDFVETGVPFISGSAIDNGVLIENNIRYITKEKFDILRAGKAKKGDILFSLRGSLNKIVRCPYESAAIASALVIIRPQNNISSDYLFLMLQTDYFQKQCSNFDNGSIQANLSVEILKILKVPFLPKNIIDFYIETANSIALKIQNNKKQIETLENLSKTIYDYWFVQFDFPNEDGRPYKSSGGKMVWNEELKREIPEGWDVKKIKDIESNIITGKTPSTKDESNFGKDIPFITIGDIRGKSFVTNTEISLSFSGAKSQKNKFIPKHSLCVTCIATPGLIGITTKESQTNQQINSINCKYEQNLYYLFFAIKDYFKYSSGAKTGNTFLNMNKEDFSNIELVYNKNVIKQFYETVCEIFNQIEKNELCNQKLCELKDWILPLLMNGQVKIEQ